jgi:RNA polymerase sigma-70 factor (ECF subfamily)
MLMNNSDFEELYSKQFDCVYRYALALTGRHSLAEEITQEAFTRLLNNGSYIKRIERPAAWLMRVARNLAMESFRDQARDRLRPEGMIPMNPEQLFFTNEIQQRVLSAVRLLSETQRDFLSLREYGGLSYEEIADVMGTSIDQVKVQLFRARRNLSKHLEDLT